MKTTAEMIEVMKVSELGETIEQSFLPHDAWEKVTVPEWNWQVCDYRIASKKPAECWVWVFPSGRCGASFESEDEARRIYYGNEGRAVLMREVTQ